MAVDTAAKRARAANTALPTYGFGPFPSGDVDRPFVAHQYFQPAPPGTRRQRRYAALRKRRLLRCK